VKDFVLANTAIASPPFVPEVRLHLATEITPLWKASEAFLRSHGVDAPFWAFAWAGGQALARYLLDRPAIVRGKRVLDFATGSGLVAIAAAKSGASRVRAIDVDDFAIEAATHNAATNEVEIELERADVLGAPLDGIDVLLAGDVCYERAMADRVVHWMRDCARNGIEVLLADPGRAYRPHEGVEELARYVVPTSIDLEGVEHKEAFVWRVLP